MTKLYELSNDYQQLERIFSENNDDLTLEALQEALRVIKEKAEDKIENVGKFILNLNSDITAIDTEMVRLSKRIKAVSLLQTKLKDYLLAEMLKLEIKEVKRPTISVSVQNSLPKVEIDVEADIPRDYLTVIPESTKPDKQKIASAYLHDNLKVPGTRVITDNKHVRIR